MHVTHNREPVDIQAVKGRLSPCTAYCLPLAELPVAGYSRDQAQRLRATMIREGLAYPDTYVSRVTLPSGTTVWRVAMPMPGGGTPECVRT